MPKQVNTKQYNITPEEYQEILKGIDFNSISLTKLEYYCDLSQHVPDAKLSLEKSASILSQLDELATIKFDFNFKALLNNSDVLIAKGEYILLFSFKDKLTQDFFNIFENTTLSNLVWPYLRELFSGLTAR